jgi:integrase
MGRKVWVPTPSGPLAPFAAGFAAWLRSRSYLPSPALRHQTLIGLLASTGLRPGEALALDCQDVDLWHGALHVRAGKHNKQR